MKLLQVDFSMNGPWGAEMSAAFTGLAESIAAEKGLIWKIWTESRETGEAGGVYLFDTMENLQRFNDMHTQRLHSFGIDSIRVRVFDVNQPLTATTFGPLSRV